MVREGGRGTGMRATLVVRTFAASNSFVLSVSFACGARGRGVSVLNYSRARELQERAIRGLDDVSRVVVDFASGACRRRADLNLPKLRRQLFHGANFPLR